MQVGAGFCVSFGMCHVWRDGTRSGRADADPMLTFLTVFQVRGGENGWTVGVDVEVPCPTMWSVLRANPSLR